MNTNHEPTQNSIPAFVPIVNAVSNQNVEPDQLELVSSLTFQLMDETIAEEGFAKLEQALLASPAARERYLEVVEMHLNLQAQLGQSPDSVEPSS